MKKEVFFRLFAGFAFGELIGNVVTLIISAAFGTGRFYPVMPFLAAHFQTELQAVTAQFLMMGLIGVVFAEGSLVFYIDRWSTLKQYVVHFVITAAFYLPFMTICWMPQNLRGVFILMLNLVFTYTVTYVIQIKISKNDIEKINRRLSDDSDRNEKAL